MEFKELKKKSKKDLHILLAQSRDKLRDLKFKDANKQLKDVREVRRKRVTIQRIMTLLNSTEGANIKSPEIKEEDKPDIGPLDEKNEVKSKK